MVRKFSRFFFRGAAAAAVGITLATVAACSSGSGEGPPSGLPALPEKNYDASDPATWTLPVEVYFPSDEDSSQIFRARTILISDCMGDFGFDWKAPPELPRVGPKTLTDLRYGIHDAALAGKRGYKPAAEEMAAYQKAVDMGAVDGTTTDGADGRVLNGGAAEVDGRKIPEGGCVGQAERELGDKGALGSPLAQQISNDAFARAKQNPKVAKIFRQWSSCMKDSGYSYEEPLEAPDDPAFSSSEVTREEIETAKADLACRRLHNVAKVWFEAETVLQKKAVEEQAEELNQGREGIEEALRKASGILAGTRRGE